MLHKSKLQYERETHADALHPKTFSSLPKGMLKNIDLPFEQDAGLPASCHVAAETEREEGRSEEEEGHVYTVLARY